VRGYALSGPGVQTGEFPDCHIISQRIPAPAAGADFTVTVPGSGGIFELVAVSAKLVTSSAVASRYVTVTVKDNEAHEVFRYASGTAVTASLTILFTLSPQFVTSAGDITNTKQLSIPLPEGPYLPNFTINSSTASVDTADQWSAVQVWWKGYFPDYGDDANE
jgi:hypothetical protein